jgi:chromosome segregation ATPase
LNVKTKIIIFHRKQVMIATLEKDVLEKSDKLATLERERETYQESMSWANKHCSEMNQKIKQLENELSKYQPYSTESYQQVQIFGQPCIKEEIIIKEEFGS